jgi:hypothetical protein
MTSKVFLENLGNLSLIKCTQTGDGHQMTQPVATAALAERDLKQL